MAVGVSVDFIWDPVMGPKLAAFKLDALEIAIRAGGFRTALDKCVREVLIPEIEFQFDVEGYPSWEKLADSTLERKANKGYSSGKILQETGKLRKAAIALARWRIHDDEATFTGLPGHVFPYGVLHLSGTKNMPVRDWARWDNQTVSACGVIFDNWLADKIRKVF